MPGVADKRPDHRAPGTLELHVADSRAMARFLLRHARVAAVLLVLFATAAGASVAWADGDPGSDVLVYQNLFAGSTAGLTIQQQTQLGDLLTAAASARFPIRVAIIAGPADLGAVTALWHEPRAYARFLGIELSQAYRQRLLVVMPNGFGFNWPGHSVAAAYARLARVSLRSSGGLVSATEAAVQTLAAANGIKLTTPSQRSGAAGASPAPSSASGGATTTSPGHAADSRAALLALAVIALASVLLAIRYGVRRRRARRPAPSSAVVAARSLLLTRRRAVPAVTALCAVAVAAPIVALEVLRAPATSASQELAFNPHLDPGTRLSGSAPRFTLSDQFGQPVSLRSYRGKVVMLAFNDSECTTVCPLTTTAMLDAKAMLGSAGSRVQLLGIDANPKAISLEDVLSYSQLHGMLHAWHFLTGSLAQLRRVWKAYGVEAAVQHGMITHTPALFVIDPRGHKAKVYVTQQSYSAVGQFGKVLADEASRLLPGHPRVHSDTSYAPIAGIAPTAHITLPRSGGGTVRLGPGRSAHLYLFFDTWNRETTSLAGHLSALDHYAATAAATGLPPLTAVDEASVEPSTSALPSFLHTLPHALSYPLAIDRTGRVADGYEVLGQPWFVLVSATGQILYYREVSTAGWPSFSTLTATMREALTRAQKIPSAASAARDLAGSPLALTDLHDQAGRLLGGEPALMARLRALRGYTVVINAWASWCTPCRAEFGLFAAASAQFGRRVAFLGVDTSDSPGDARSFLHQHPVSYPSYQAASPSALSALAAIEGLPTTIFINSAGRTVSVHTGQYDSQGTLNADIARAAQG
jgi:cytochrome oxidase Cu insertion factor (SCO1/SenC/PrrC family)/thiol-disulfide isomerase/thioredoxin